MHPLVQRCWVATQVELQGHYSVAQVHRLAKYHAATPWWRVLLVCLLTPVPCVACVILVDLYKLEPTTTPSLESPRLWTRTFVSTIIMTMSTLEHFRQHIPGMHLTRRLMVAVSICVSVITVWLTIGMSLLIGYPLPFGLILGTFPWFFTLMTLLLVSQWRRFHDNKRLGWNTVRYLMVCACQIGITLVYPLYNYTFVCLDPVEQTLFVLVLPVLKIIAKNGIARALDATDVGKPEAVVFNIEIFHALYTAFCMQSAASTRTVLALMSVDAVQAWLSFNDVQALLHELAPVANKLDAARQKEGGIGARHGNRALQHLLWLTNRVVEVEPHMGIHHRIQRKPRIRASVLRSLHASWKRVISRVGPAPSDIQTTSPVLSAPVLLLGDTSSLPILPGIQDQVLPDRQLPADLAVLNVVERGVLVRHTQEMLYITEFIVLVEYVEVIMPVVYNVLIVALYYLPNRQFYPFLRELDVDSLFPTLSNVLLYASLELVSLLAFTLVLWWKLRLSILHQLAFVLENRQSSVQSKLVVWVIYVMQCSIDHFGADYSFRFEWLQS